MTIVGSEPICSTVTVPESVRESRSEVPVTAIVVKRLPGVSFSVSVKTMLPLPLPLADVIVSQSACSSVLAAVHDTSCDATTVIVLFCEA